MPIKFRCAYCQKLLAITRRKAGTVIKCPKCSGEVMVPGVQGNGNDDDDGDIEVPDPPRVEPPKPRSPAPPPVTTEKRKSSPAIPTLPEKEIKKAAATKPIPTSTPAKAEKPAAVAPVPPAAATGIPSSAVVGLGIAAFFLIFVALVTGLLFGRIWGLSEASRNTVVQEGGAGM